MKNIFFSYCICILFSLIAYTSAAQKLPDKQRNGVFILANLKVDGKATEWDNKFQAYNKTVEVFYTIANDSDKLYLIIQATEPDVMNKIMRSGVDFSVNSLTKERIKQQ